MKHAVVLVLAVAAALVVAATIPLAELLPAGGSFTAFADDPLAGHR